MKDYTQQWANENATQKRPDTRTSAWFLKTFRITINESKSPSKMVYWENKARTNGVSEEDIETVKAERQDRKV
jgi:hypothetical protein